jgi:hypothetical protein
MYVILDLSGHNSPTPTKESIMRNSNEGMHWRKISDRTLRAEAMNRAARFNRHLDDIEEEHDGSIEVAFGSTGASITLRKLDEGTFTIFSSGYCTFLAWAIHERTGLPLAVFSAPSSENEGWFGHATIMVGEDRFLDIDGIHSAARIQERYQNKLNPGYEIMEAADYVKLIVQEKNQHDPLSFVDDLERFIVEDFAEYVLKLYQVPVPVA